MGDSKVGQTKNVAIIYSIIASAIIIAVATEQSINSYQLTPKTDLWAPLFLLLTSIGVYRKTRWGRWFG